MTALMQRAAWKRLVLAGLVTGIVDGLFACVLVTFFYNSTFMRLWQGVASALLGEAAFQGGTRTVLIGLLMHFGVAFAWSTVFFLVCNSAAVVRRITSTWGGILGVAAIYGPFIWAVMSLVVIPLLRDRAPTITVRWWIQGIGHFPFVGLPIVASIAARRAPQAAKSLAVAALALLFSACATAPAHVDPAAVTREAEQFMSTYAADLRAADREAIAARYDVRGAYGMYNGRKSFDTAEQIASQYREHWRPPAAFEWVDLSYDVINADTVLVLGGFLWTAPEKPSARYSYTALLVRDAAGKLRIRLENEAPIPPQ